MKGLFEVLKITSNVLGPSRPLSTPEKTPNGDNQLSCGRDDLPGLCHNLLDVDEDVLGNDDDGQDSQEDFLGAGHVRDRLGRQSVQQH